jgi:hypothetical protein
MKVAISWDVVPCSPYMNQRFGRTFHLHLQGRKSAEPQTLHSNRRNCGYGFEGISLYSYLLVPDICKCTKWVNHTKSCPEKLQKTEFFVVTVVRTPHHAHSYIRSLTSPTHLLTRFLKLPCTNVTLT